MTNFYIYLSSNTTRDSQIGKFTVHLPKELNFNSKWSVSLSSFIYNHSWNILGNSKADTITVYLKNGDRKVYYFGKMNPFNPKQLEENLNAELRSRKRSKRGSLALKAKKQKEEATLLDAKMDDSQLIDSSIKGNELKTSESVDDNKLNEGSLKNERAELIDSRIEKAKLIDSKMEKTELIDSKIEEKDLIDSRINKDELIKNEDIKSSTPTPSVAPPTIITSKTQEDLQNGVKTQTNAPKIAQQTTHPPKDTVAPSIALKTGDTKTKEEKEKGGQQRESNQLEIATLEAKKVEEEKKRKEGAKILEEAQKKMQQELEDAKKEMNNGLIDAKIKETDLIDNKEKTSITSKESENLSRNVQEDNTTSNSADDKNELIDSKISFDELIDSKITPDNTVNQDAETKVRVPYSDGLVDLKIPDHKLIDLSLVNIWNDLSEEDRKKFNNAPKDLIQLVWHEELNRFELKISDSNVKSVSFSEDLAYVLGFKSTDNLSTDKIANWHPDLNGGISTMLIYANNLVETMILSNKMVELLQVVNINSKPGEQVEKHFLAPVYNRVASRSIKTIDIEIRSITGDLIDFRYGPIILCLHFRKDQPF